MFAVVRSVFWLTLAYIVIKPAVDLPDANALSAQAMAAGSRVIAEQIQTIECDSFECVGGKAIAAAALQSSPSAGVSMHVPSPANLAPMPRPRPDRAG